jgi:peptide/nickel transport system permease protein
VTVQAEVLRLLKALVSENNVSLIFITHDFGVIGQLCDRVIVMYAGQVVEQGKTNEVLQSPMHPYTSKLVECVPKLGHLDKARVEIPGMPPAVDDLPVGCFFAPRCTMVADTCKRGPIDLASLENGRSARCLRLKKTSSR